MLRVVRIKPAQVMDALYRYRQPHMPVHSVSREVLLDKSPAQKLPRRKGELLDTVTDMTHAERHSLHSCVEIIRHRGLPKLPPLVRTGKREMDHNVELLHCRQICQKRFSSIHPLARIWRKVS